MTQRPHKYASSHHTHTFASRNLREKKHTSRNLYMHKFTLSKDLYGIPDMYQSALKLLIVEVNNVDHLPTVQSSSEKNVDVL